MPSCPCDPTCQSIRQDARHLWLTGGAAKDGSSAGSTTLPIPEDDTTTMARVESLYRNILTRTCCCGEQRDAREKLALILLQSGRSRDADVECLEPLGFTCRLARQVFGNKPTEGVDGELHHTITTTPGRMSTSTNSYCRVFDNVLPEHELVLLQDVFSNIHSSYWTDHNYQVEPPSPYYSYVLPLNETKTETMQSVIYRLRKCLQVHFPALKTATAAEVWAHNRPHATGHQFHFDSDNEGCTEIIRNPIISCVLYLSHGSGGPTVVTNQRLSSRGLASAAWMVPTETSNRLLAFDGKLLHGVVPGAGSSPHRRVSLMIAFWKNIRVRQTKGSAACQWPAPKTTLWADALMVPSSSPLSDTVTMNEVLPIPVSPVYEAVPSGEPWTRSKGLPDYELMFQGM